MSKQASSAERCATSKLVRLRRFFSGTPPPPSVPEMHKTDPFDDGDSSLDILLLLFAVTLNTELGLLLFSGKYVTDVGY